MTLGIIRTDLPEFKDPKELTLTLWLEDGKARNWWRFWVYPDDGPLEPDSDILVAQEWNDEVKAALLSGGKVLLTPSKESVAKAVDAKFWTEFWSARSNGSMGIYCDPEHPSLAQFPTRSHSDWQWYDLLTDSYALILNDLPFEFEPVVHMIDFFKTSYRLGMILEAKVGNGRLLVSTLNLGKDAERTLSQKQMLRSLLDYAASDTFQPRYELTAEQLDGLFTNAD